MSKADSDLRLETLLYMPAGQHVDLAATTPTQTDTRVVQKFAAHVFKENIINVSNTGDYIRRSFLTLYWMYVVLFVIGVFGAVLTVVKGLTAQSASDAGGAAVIGGLSVASFLAIFVTRPLESLERNTIYDSWLTAVTNSYWTRLMYFNDPKTIDQDLKHATDDLVDELGKLADKHAGAISKYASPSTDGGAPPKPGSDATKPSADGAGGAKMPAGATHGTAPVMP